MPRPLWPTEVDLFLSRHTVSDCWKQAVLGSGLCVNAQAVPPWGIVVEWMELNVLVFRGADGTIHYIEVSDRPEFHALPKTYDASKESMFYHIPGEIGERILSMDVPQTAVDAASYAGRLAGALTSPLLTGPLAPLTIGIVLVAAAIWLPRGAR